MENTPKMSNQNQQSDGIEQYEREHKQELEYAENIALFEPFEEKKKREREQEESIWMAFPSF